MTKKIRPIFKYMAFLALGILIGSILSNNSLSAQIENPFGQTIEQASPNDYIKEQDITVLQDKVTINIKNAKWAKFTNTNSMDPVLDTGANALQIVPTQEQLQVGDIITYKLENTSIIHRIVEIGNDGTWYAYAKGDNNAKKDTEKIRFEQIEKVLIGILY